MYGYEYELQEEKEKGERPMIEIKFAKLTDGAKIPSKRDEDLKGSSFILIPPHTTKMIPTGIASIIPQSHCFILKERGSTGTKGMAQRCGVIDSGYRGEWLVPITNTTDRYLYIYDDNCDIQGTWLGNSDALILYPASKAICQALLVEVPQTKITEISVEELKTDETERGDGKLGSSGK